MSSSMTFAGIGEHRAHVVLSQELDMEESEKRTSSVERSSSLLLAGNSNCLALAGPSIVLRVLTTHRKPLQTSAKAASGMDCTES